MFYWIYDISSGTLAILMALSCIGYTWLGLVLLRPRVRKWLGPQPGENEFVGHFLSAYGVFYGLMLGLIAVATYQNYSDAEKATAKEAATLAAIYRDVSSYPEPARSNHQGDLREYVRYVIEEAWADQQRGVIPAGGTARVTKFQSDLFAFQPKTKVEEILHAETLRVFNDFVQARAERLRNVTTGLPKVLWYVVILGGALNLSLIWMFSIDRLSVHLALSGILSAFVGLMLFFIAAMDNPFRGAVSISPEAFEIVQERLMKQ